jgi:hypothetical protein
MRRVQSGQSGEQMTNLLAGQLGGAPFKYFGDWIDRVAKGELPHSKPPRPQGVEHNRIVVSYSFPAPVVSPKLKAISLFFPHRVGA